METVAGGGRQAARRRACAIAALAAWCAIICGACAKPAPATPSGYLQVDINTSPAALDPRIAADAISERVAELIYDSLVRIGRDGHFYGDLAASIERPSPVEIIFHLRHGVRFSDGRPLTARDVQYTYASVLDPATQSIKRAGFAELATLRAADDYTIVMTTRRPYAPALEMAMLGIVPADTPAPGAGAAIAPAGSGPFALADFRRDESVTLARNAYSSYAAGGVPGIVFKIVPNATVRVLELAEGICDFTENDGVQPELIPYLAAKPDLTIVKSPGTTYQYLIFNFRDARLRDPRVRRAIAYAIDRAAIVASLLRGNARVASGMLAPEDWAYDGAVTRYPYDPDKARALLEAAGYEARARPLRLVYKTTPEGSRLAQAIQAMLLRVGVAVDIHINDFATFYSDLRNGNFDLAASQWVGVGDPHQYYAIFDSRMMPAHGGNNRGDYANPRMDQLVEQGDATLDPAARRAIYGTVQQLAADDLPYVSLWWIDNVAAYNRRLAGFAPYPNGSLLSLAAAAYGAPRGPRRAAQ
ncbi:MAG TPA: ABC transporter substrate-binding protein [Candidatus Binataceae bacterium]|nr:ABC transporter substrate-binding protein [Candidatus Binataceae bacterium]